MLHSPRNSTVEEIFAPYEIVTDSPLDDLIREVSVSPTEELLAPESIIISDSSSDLFKKSTKETNNLSKRKAKKDINPTKKLKSMPINNVNKLKPVSRTMPCIIKTEPSENDPPVISIPDMDFIEPEVLVYILNIIMINFMMIICYIF